MSSDNVIIDIFLALLPSDALEVNLQTCLVVGRGK